jgi:circadian clock protein KaiC
MPEQGLVKTGIVGLDAILNGGIPRGNLIVLEGPAGSGKTTLGLEFICRGASEFNEPGLIVLFEVAPSKVIRDAAQFGWDLQELERQGKLKIIFTTRSVLEQELQQADSLLLAEGARIGAQRMFIDSLPPLQNPGQNGHNGNGNGNGNGSGTREMFHTLVQGLHRENLTAMLSVETPDLERVHSGAPTEEFIADTIIALNIQDTQRAATRTIEVVKSRGHDFQMGSHSFRIVDKHGLEVYKRVQAPRGLSREMAAAYDPTTRVTTGVPGLDPLVNGGYFLGSTTLLVGVSGVGKSVMGLQFIAEGARRGEKSIIMSLDEAPAQITRNARTIGIDLEALIAQGLVRVQYDSPQEIEIDRHFAKIEAVVNEFQPKRVVIDSLSTYGSALGSSLRIFRDFFHALVALMKEHQIAAVYNHENPEILGMTSMAGEYGMSSLVDNILLLNWVELSDEFRLALTIAKMRANPTRRVTCECEVLDGQGMRVLPREVGASALPLSAYYGLVSRSPERHVRAPLQQGVTPSE